MQQNENSRKASRSQSIEIVTPNRLTFDELPNSGECGSLMMKVDWSTTLIGLPSQWPSSLSTVVSICLTSRFPIVLLCGPKFELIYNDSYAPMLGRKHPQALGKPGFEVWGEIWHIIGPMLQEVRDSGHTTWSDDLLLVINRTGYLEEAYFTFSYTPVGVDVGDISAVFTAVNFTTERVIGERRLRTLRDLGTQSRVAETSETAAKGMLEVLSKNKFDVPFAFIYLFDKSTPNSSFRTAKLVSWCGVPAGTEISPMVLDTEGIVGSFQWPVEEALRTRKAVQVDCNAIKHLLPKEPWDDPPTHAVVIPIAQAGHDEHTGLFIGGVSARKALDEPYLDFYQLVASQIAMAIINAEAYQAERRRVEELAKIDQAKSAFFSNVSHELRTPLTLMLSPIEDLLDDKHKLTVFQFERMQLVQRNTQRLLKLVNSLLDFSKIEANRMQAIFEPTDLVELTSNLALAFRSTVEKAGLQLFIDTSPLTDLVYVDKEMWEKIVFNLLSNAFKFTFEGFIKVSLHRQGSDVEFRIQDTGVGIPEEHQSRVFERFHRVETIQGRSFEGTGIGLALVHELVKLHSGSIRLESVRGEGTTFTVTIPLGTSHLSFDQLSKKRELYDTGRIGMAYVEEAKRWVADKIGDLEPANNKLPFFDGLKTLPASAKLLICDDNHDMRQYLKSILEVHWQVIPVCNGVEALESIKMCRPDLVLTDVMMPQMDGFQLLNALRNDPDTSSIPVIMLSARAGEEARVEGLHAGADDYLVKPFSAKELLARVHTHLELGQLRRKLEEGIQQRTQQLQEANHKLKTELQERLQAEKELVIETSRAQAAEEYKKRQEEFVNTICHEIRNPLNGIYGGIDLLQQAIVDTEILMTSSSAKILPDMDKLLMEKLQQLKELVDNISRCAIQQKTIVDDVLDLSKIQNNKIELVSVPFNPKQVLTTVVQMFSAQICQKKLKLSMYISDVDFWVKGDPHRLTQVITNLVSNAVKFTHEGSITLGGTVQKKSPDSDKVVLKFSVQDTGIGMTAEEQATLFGEFVQANKSISLEYGGSGLGLAICKKLVGLMGGKISTKSEKWQGSKFTFNIECFPCSPEEHLALSKPEKKRSHASITRMDSLNKTILIVEDNKINQKILLRHLEDGGYFCRTASNGNEAIDMYQRYSFDLIFMDIEMPGMNGLLATQEIRKIEAASNSPAVPIVGLSGNAGKEPTDKALQAGMTDYLTKPYQKNELFQKISQLTDQDPTPNKHAKGDT